MAFLTPDEMKTHIYPNVQNVISQDDATLLQDAIDAAILEAKGYCSRYRIAQLFDNEDAEDPFVKDSILLRHCKNIAKWHFIGLANPDLDYDDAELRYSQAISWLTKVQKGAIVPPDWPQATAFEGAETFFHVKSNEPRNNYF
jgi:phage gp36-like protein